MRTTVTLDADVARKLRELTHRRRTSFEAVLNETIPRGLDAQERSDAVEPFSVEPHHGGFRPGLDVGKLDQLLDQLDTDEFLLEARRGR
ncbi:MAG: hypothetical protein HY815_31235 [Candidatus Riflebacteria bacterium]|nr:hypothetical protein [Candidatus Riflebacteria bacterium]